MDFSVVVPFRDTPKEREFAKKSIPSMVRLKPSEIIIGMDKPVTKSTIKYVKDMFEDLSFSTYRILEVPRSGKWNFQLANVIWHCYKACKNDKILASDVDNVLRSTVLDGYDLIGVGKIGIVSFTKKLLIKNISDRIRYFSYRLAIRRRSNVFTGIYWVYRPYYFEDIDIEEFKTIYNGIDTHMFDRMTKLGRHNIVTLKDIGIDALDYQNEDYPWRQFQDGIWLYAHPEGIGTCEKKSLYGRIRDRSIKSLNKIMPFSIILRTVCYQHPWMLRGWMWARSHKHDEIVRIAKDTSESEWGYAGSQHVRGMRDWQQEGMTGTGFD